MQVTVKQALKKKVSSKVATSANADCALHSSRGHHSLTYATMQMCHSEVMQWGGYCPASPSTMQSLRIQNRT